MKEQLKNEDLIVVRKYRKTSGIMTAIAVAMYITCWLPLVICGAIGESLGATNDMWGVLGLSIMMLIVAVATGLLIVNSHLKPVCLKDNKRVVLDGDGEEEENEDEEKSSEGREEKSSVQIGVSSAIWLSALVGYLCLGFGKGLWHPGWIIFIVAIVVDKVASVIFSVVRKKRDEAKKS